MDAKSAENVGMFLKNKMKRDEALSVLNLQDVKGDVDLEIVQKVRMFCGWNLWVVFLCGRKDGLERGRWLWNETLCFSHYV